MLTTSVCINVRYLEADGLEKTYKFTQKEIANAVDIGSAQKVNQTPTDFQFSKLVN